MKTKFCIAAIIIFITAAGTSLLFAQTSGEFKTLDPVTLALDAAYESYLGGDYADAKAQVAMVVGKEKLNPRAWFYLGLCDYQSKNYKEAFLCLEKAIKYYPLSQDRIYDVRITRYNLALEKIRLYREELRELEVNVQVNQNCFTRKIQNRINFVQGKLSELQNLEEPKRIQKIPSEYYFHMGNCLLKLNQLQFAHDAYQMALISNPENGDAFHNLAIINFMVKRYDDANEYLAKAKNCGATINENFETQLIAQLK